MKRYLLVLLYQSILIFILNLLSPCSDAMIVHNEDSPFILTDTKGESADVYASGARYRIKIELREKDYWYRKLKIIEPAIGGVFNFEEGTRKITGVDDSGVYESYIWQTPVLASNTPYTIILKGERLRKGPGGPGPPPDWVPWESSCKGKLKNPILQIDDPTYEKVVSVDPEKDKYATVKAKALADKNLVIEKGVPLKWDWIDPDKPSDNAGTDQYFEWFTPPNIRHVNSYSAETETQANGYSEVRLYVSTSPGDNYRVRAWYAQDKKPTHFPTEQQSGIIISGVKLIIKKPEKDADFDVTQNNYIQTQAIDFMAKIIPEIEKYEKNKIDWNLFLEYKTSGGKDGGTNTRKFSTFPADIHQETYKSMGGRVKVNASTTIDKQELKAEEVKITITGVAIPDSIITNRLVDLYRTGATPRLMTGIAMKESSYMQFSNRTLYGHYDRWPRESYDSGSHIGLMMVSTTVERAWDWLTNTDYGVSVIFKGGLRVSKNHEIKYRKDYPKLRKLTATEHEDNSLSYYRLGTAFKTCDYWVPDPNTNYTDWMINPDNPVGVSYARSCKELMK